MENEARGGGLWRRVVVIDIVCCLCDDTATKRQFNTTQEHPTCPLGLRWRKKKIAARRLEFSQAGTVNPQCAASVVCTEGRSHTARRHFARS